MRIIHLSDFHYCNNQNTYQQRNIVTEIVKTLKAAEKIDLLIFSGDLVFSGERQDDFYEAHTMLIETITTELNIPFENILMCQGNHDVNRKECLSSLAEYSKTKLITNEEIENFVKRGGKDFSESLTPSRNYLNYLQDKFKHYQNARSGFIYSHRCILDGKTVGMIAINTAWFSSHFQEDNKNLIFPLSLLEAEYEKISKSDLKIFISHHPLSYLKEDNYRQIEDFVHGNFILNFCGHEHKERISSNYKAGNGIFCNSSQASLSLERDAEIGFSIVNYTLDNPSKINLERFYYLKKENSFYGLEPIHIRLPVGEEKNKENRLRKKVTSKFPQELELANKLLVDYSEDSAYNFLDNFTTPNLSKSSESSHLDVSLEDHVNLNDLFDSETNLIIYGKDKSGKTTLLKKFLLHFLYNYSIKNVIPFYLDYKEEDDTNDDLITLFKRYYEINNADAVKLFETNKVVLIIDNLNPHSTFHSKVLFCLEKFKSLRFIITSDETMALQYLENLNQFDHAKIYLKNITRKEIRLYTEKFKKIKNDDIENVLEKLTHLCTQLQLPVNYWTISLLLFVYKKSNDDYQKNLFNVLDIMVDELLQKKKSLYTKSKLNFSQYKQLCSELAYYLYTNHSRHIYTASFEEIIEFLGNYTKNKPRITSNSKDIFDNLLASGLITQKGIRYTFRLMGIFEYFLAFYISENQKFRLEILNDEKLYLSFKNELELYSGFKRNDKEFVSIIYRRTKFLFKSIIEKYNVDIALDKALIDNIDYSNRFVKAINKIKANPIQFQEQDKIKDVIAPLNTDSEVHLKEVFEHEKNSFESLEKHINILARVLKNSDELENLNFINEIFDFVINAYCSLGFFLIQEIEKTVNNESVESIEDGNIFEMLNIIGKIIPLVVQNMLHDGLGHKNFETIITEKINLFKNDLPNNQYRLFLLYYLLIDSDMSKKEIIEEVFKNIKIPALKFSTILKLKMYMTFKAYGDKKLEQFLETNIQKAQQLFDTDSDRATVQKSLNTNKKVNIIRKRSER
jgi:predicted phosphodiesterase